MKVHIADNHPILIEGVISVLKKNNIEIEGTSKNGLEVIMWSEKNEADVLLLDYRMPIYDGIDVLKHFRKKGIQQKVLIYSVYNRFELINEAMKLGANGYVLKEDGYALVDALVSIHKGRDFFSKDVMSVVINKNIDFLDAGVKSESRLILQELADCKITNLSIQEKSIIKLMAKKYNSDEIQETLQIKGSTYRSYTSRIREKLNIKTTEELIKYSIAIS